MGRVEYAAELKFAKWGQSVTKDEERAARHRLEASPADLSDADLAALEVTLGTKFAEQAFATRRTAIEARKSAPPPPLPPAPQMIVSVTSLEEATAKFTEAIQQTDPAFDREKCLAKIRAQCERQLPIVFGEYDPALFTVADKQFVKHPAQLTDADLVVAVHRRQRTRRACARGTRGVHAGNQRKRILDGRRRLSRSRCSWKKPA